MEYTYKNFEGLFIFKSGIKKMIGSADEISLLRKFKDSKFIISLTIFKSIKKNTDLKKIKEYKKGDKVWIPSSQLYIKL